MWLLTPNAGCGLLDTCCCVLDAGSGTSAAALAVLHPRKLAVYSVSGEGGVGVSAAFFKLNKVYDHNLGVAGLHFTAFNMTYGPFGNVSGTTAAA